MCLHASRMPQIVIVRISSVCFELMLQLGKIVIVNLHRRFANVEQRKSENICLVFAHDPNVLSEGQSAIRDL
jgi:hypothetical protein